MVFFIFIIRKEEGMAIHPTFNVSVIFGKRDEVSYPGQYKPVSFVSLAD